jgi:hypothetical protein
VETENDAESNLWKSIDHEFPISGNERFDGGYGFELAMVIRQNPDVRQWRKNL